VILLKSRFKQFWRLYRRAVQKLKGQVCWAWRRFSGFKR